MIQVRQIKIGKHQTGIVGLDEALKETASKHLKILEDAGLVTSVKGGLWVNYSIISLNDHI